MMVGSNLSGTFASAEAAAFHFDGAPVHLVDSLGASLLQGLMVLKGAELAELAHSPMEVVQELNRIRRQSGVLLTIDRFDRLMASGRMGRRKAWFARALGIKPVLRVPIDGQAVEPVGKAFGRKRVLPALLDALRKEIPSGVEKVRFGIPYVGCPGLVEDVTAKLRSEYGDVEILSAPATPVIATHLGIGAWGIAFLVED